MNHCAQRGTGSHYRHRYRALSFEVMREDGHAGDIDETCPNARQDALRQKYLLANGQQSLESVNKRGYLM